MKSVLVVVVIMLAFASGAFAQEKPASSSNRIPSGDGIAFVGYTQGGAKRHRAKASQVIVIEISRGHLNRIVTPFEHPEVWTGSDASIQQRDGVLYVLAKNQDPVSLFLTEKGDETVAMNVTLVPREVPAVEIILDFERKLAARVKAARMQRAALKKQPAAPNVRQVSVPRGNSTPASSGYVDRLKSLLRDLSSGEVPNGFRTVSPTRHSPCGVTPGFETRFAGGQRYLSKDFDVVIGTVRNVATAGQFREIWCGSESVAAVAIAPRALLQPGERAEIFIVRRRGALGSEAERPSLIRQGG